MQLPNQQEWLTVIEVAKIFQIHEETVRRWIRSGDLPAFDVGGPRAGYRIRRDDLDAFVAARYKRLEPRP